MLPQSAGSETELRDLISVVWRRKWVVVLLMAAVTAAVLVLTNLQTERYEATAQVLIRGRETADVIDTGSSNPQEANRDLANELAFIQSDAVRAEISDRLNGPGRFAAQKMGDGDVIAVRAVGTDPVRVANIANTAADVYVELRGQRVISDYVETAGAVQEQIDAIVPERDALTEPVERFRATLDPNEVDEFGTPVNTEAEINAYEAELARLEAGIATDLNRLDATESTLLNTLGQLELTSQLLQDGTAQVIRAARVPTEPFEPDLQRNALIGLGAGLVLGLAAAFLWEYMDDSLRTKDHVERAGAHPVLGVIPHQRVAARGKAISLVTLEKQGSPASEAYRSLWTSLEFLGLEDDVRIILVTSAHSGAGKTTTVSNLGVTLANAGRNVILLDCDLRLPTLHEVFGLKNRVGFTSLVLGACSPGEAVQFVPGIPKLQVLSSGPLPPRPAELLASDRAKNLIRRIGEAYDFVLIDSPPAVPVSDPLILSKPSHGVVVVVRARKTSERDLREAEEILVSGGAPLLGTVLNGAKLPSAHPYGYGVAYGKRPEAAGPIDDAFQDFDPSPMAQTPGNEPAPEDPIPGQRQIPLDPQHEGDEGADGNTRWSARWQMLLERARRDESDAPLPRSTTRGD